jgi:hypothetical protein
MMKVMKILVYLDLCCYNRQFDVQFPAAVEEETKAVEEIFVLVKNGDIELVWSYVLTVENSHASNENNKKIVADWENYAVCTVAPNKNIENIAQQIQLTGVKEFDSLHVAAAIHAHCNFFVTTDYKIPL